MISAVAISEKFILHLFLASCFNQCSKNRHDKRDKNQKVKNTIHANKYDTDGYRVSLSCVITKCHPLNRT